MTAFTPPAQELVERAQAGDADAFRALFERYHGPIRAHVYGMVGDWGRAEELTQDAFLRVWLALPTTSREAPLAFQAFAYRVAINVAKDELRALLVRRAVTAKSWELHQQEGHSDPAAPDDPTQGIVDQEVEDEVRAVLEGIYPAYRRALELRAFDDLDYDEIGERLHLTRQGVKGVLHRGRREARQQYDARHPGAMRPVAEACPVGVQPVWSTRSGAWRYHVSVCVICRPGGVKTSRHFGTYDTLAEATEVLRHRQTQAVTP